MSAPEELQRLWARACAGGSRRPVILIDGGSGAGKTTLARALVAAAPVPAHLVSLDMFYPGWDGLAAASRMLVDDVLASPTPGYRRWDWERDVTGEWVALDPDVALVVEGCGALTPASKPFADLALWVDLDADTRRERALARDGDAYAPHWERWAAQEREHWRRHAPASLADVVVYPSSHER